MRIKEESMREVSKEYDRWRHVCSLEVDFCLSMNSALWLSHNSFCTFVWIYFVGVVPLLSMRREDISLKHMTVA
jgi:hypothetical protein